MGTMGIFLGLENVLRTMGLQIKEGIAQRNHLKKMNIINLITPQFFQVALESVLPILLINKIIFFIIYKYTKNVAVVDIGYTLGHFLAGLTYAHYVGNMGTFDTWIKLLILGSWTYRMGYFLWRTRISSGIKDPRMEEIFKKFPPNSYSRDAAVLGQYIFQGFLVLITSSSLYWMFKNQLSWDLTQSKDFRLFNYLALFIGIVGIIYEGVADNQLQSFKENKLKKDDSSSIFQRGLWKTSRHPNLFFDSVTWFAFAATGVFSIFDSAAFVGPICLQLVKDLVTVPITERHMKQSSGEQFVEYKKKTHKYWPF